MENLVIKGANNQATTNSLLVAEKFGKENADVVRAIDNLLSKESANNQCNAKLGLHSMFAVYYDDIPQPNGGSKQAKRYIMNRDGFSLLVMGFTGAKALQFKLDFIEAFNQMENQIKQGGFAIPQSFKEALLLAAAQQEQIEEQQKQLNASNQKVQLLEGENTLLTSENQKLAPKAEYVDDVLQSTSTFTLTQVAHDLGLRSVHVLTKLLNEQGILFKQSNQWQPTAKVADKKYFATRTSKYIKSDNTIGTSLATVVTELGRAYLHKLLERINK